MSNQRDYQELYDRLLEEVGALHRANQRRIRSGMWALLGVTVGLMLLMFLSGGNKVFTLMLWILSMFAVAAYLIAVEYMDYELQKKLRDIAQLEDHDFGTLMNVPELPAAPELPRMPRLLHRSGGARLQTAHPKAARAASHAEASRPENEAPSSPASAVQEEIPAVQENIPAEKPAEPSAPVQPHKAASQAGDASRYTALPRGWERVLEDPDKLADDLALLTQALQNLSDDLRQSGSRKEGER